MYFNAYLYDLYDHLLLSICTYSCTYKKDHLFSNSYFTEPDIIAAEAGGVSVSQNFTQAQ